jgi:hypothetical protein
VPTVLPTVTQQPSTTHAPTPRPTPSPTVRCASFPKADGCWPDADWRFVAGASAAGYGGCLALLLCAGCAGRLQKHCRKQCAWQRAHRGDHAANEEEVFGLVEAAMQRNAMGELEMVKEISLEYGENEVLCAKESSLPPRPFACLALLSE